MSRFVLDCSVSAAWCFGDQKNAYVDRVLDAFAEGFQALVPPLWTLETLNVLILAERRKRLLEAEVGHFFEMYRSLPIITESTPWPFQGHQAILSLCRRYGLTAYDAAYLETAIRNGIPLATQDEALRAASGQSGVPVFGIG